MFKKGLFLFLTAFLLICSVSLASASGLFSELNETDYADERLPVLDEVADVVSVSQTIDSVTVEVSQAYYEGNRVYVSYKATEQIYEQDGLELEDGSYADIIVGAVCSRRMVQSSDGKNALFQRMLLQTTRHSAWYTVLQRTKTKER